MKKIILFTIILFCALTIKAQQQLSYAYDAAGNRVNRTIVVGARSADTSSEQPGSPFFEETLAERQIKIYPNPVQSDLTIRIADYQASLEGEFSLFNMNGATLRRGRITGETTHVNMGRYLPGTYLLNIILKGERTVWKVIKQ